MIATLLPFAITALATTALPQSLVAQSPSRDTTTPPAAQFTFAYTGTLLTNAAGGISRGSLFQNAALIESTINLQRLIGWKSAQVFVSMLGTTGPSPDQFVGDLQGVLSTTAPPGLRLEEAWLEQDLLRNHLSLLAGRYDINTEFYRLQSSGIFLNSSFGIGPELSLSGVEGPSTYPFTALGGRVAYKPTRNTVLRVAILDGIPVDRPDGGMHPFARGDGAFAISEFAILSRPDTGAVIHDRRFIIGRRHPRPYAAKIAIGAWGYSMKLPDLADTLPNGLPVLHSPSGGAYLIADGVVWHSPNRTRELAMFGQLGFGDPAVQRVERYTGAGVALTGPFSRRLSDQIGLAVASASIGEPYRHGQHAAGIPTSSPETAIELTYVANVASWIGLHADLQYIMQPGGVISLRNALVPALQVGVSQTF